MSRSPAEVISMYIVHSELKNSIHPNEHINARKFLKKTNLSCRESTGALSTAVIDIKHGESTYT